MKKKTKKKTSKQIWRLQVLWKDSYKIFHFSRDHVINRSLSGLDLSTVSHHSAKFGGHSYCESAGVSFLNLSRYQVIKTSREFEGWVSPLQVTTLPNLVTIDIVEEQIYVF